MTDSKEPRLETDRLILRPPQAEDVDQIRVLLDNWEIAKWLGALPFPYPTNAAREWFGRMQEGQARGEKAPFMICMADDPRLDPIGSVGLHRHEGDKWGFGFWLGQPYWRRGIMSEAAVAATHFAMERLKAERLEAIYFIGNEGSARILQRCGFAPIKEHPEWCEARGQKVDAVELELTLENWASQLHSPPIS